MERQFPSAGVELTTLLVVSDIGRSCSFYRDVLGAEIFREYGGTSCVLNFQGNWILLVTGGGPPCHALPVDWWRRGSSSFGTVG